MNTLIKCNHFDMYQILDIDLVLVVSVFFVVVCCCLFVLFLVLLVCTLRWGVYGMYIVPKCVEGILTTYVCKCIYIYIHPPGNDHISYLWKTNIIFKRCLGRGYVSSQEGKKIVR